MARVGGGNFSPKIRVPLEGVREEIEFKTKVTSINRASIGGDPFPYGGKTVRLHAFVDADNKDSDIGTFHVQVAIIGFGAAINQLIRERMYDDGFKKAVQETWGKYLAGMCDSANMNSGSDRPSDKNEEG